MEEGDTIEVYQQQTGGVCWDLRLFFDSLKMDLIKNFCSNAYFGKEALITFYLS